MKRQSLCISGLAIAMPIFFSLGCGGANGSGATTSTGSGGGVSYSIVGAAQNPVLSAGNGSAVIGLAGASFTDISQIFSARILTNTRIAFFSPREGNFEIYTMNTSGSDIVNLTNNIGSDQNPVWSPNGTKIAFKSFRDAQGEVYTMNADGSGQTRLTNNVATDSDPAWSPNGSQLVFKSTRTANNDIWVMNSADGTGLLQLTTDVNTDQDPNWSPDGNTIAFATNRDGDFEIFTMSAVNGSALTQLTTNTFSDIHPSFSPDGTQIAFESQRDGNSEIYVMNADGSGQTRLTTNANTDSFPTWSPDGTKIVFHTNRDGNFEIYTMSNTGLNQTRLTNNVASDQVPSWSTYLAPPKFIGTGGTMGASCAGFLVGHQGAQTTSLVVFDTPLAARSGSRVVANTNPDTNSPNLIFTITTSTGLSSLTYVNTADGVVTSPIVPVGSTGALVDFEASTGNVVSLIPFTANRGPAKATYKGSTVTYTASFTAIFDGKGKNMAPSGASSVTIDTLSGKLISFQ